MVQNIGMLMQKKPRCVMQKEGDHKDVASSGRAHGENNGLKKGWRTVGFPDLDELKLPSCLTIG